MRRASRLDYDASGKVDDAEERFAKRLGANRRASEQMESVHESVPAWLASHVNATQDASNNELSTVDILGEFLQDEDMINLEVLCMKWRGLDETDIEAISKISPDIVKSMVQGDKDVREYCSYRRECAWKHYRKATVQNNIQSSMHRKTVVQKGSDSEDEDDSDDDKSPAFRGRKTGKVEDDAKQHESPKSLAQRKKSVIAPDQRRKSVVPDKLDSSRLARAGGNIVGQDDAKPSLAKETPRPGEKTVDPTIERKRKQSMFAGSRSKPLSDG